MAGKFLFNNPQELSGAGTLNHAVIVGGSHGHDLTDAGVGQLRRRGSGPFCRERGSAHSNDGSLTSH